MSQEVRIPDIGDIDEVEVIEICVAPGDEVGPDDALIVIESDKASMEVPAGIGGVVAAIAVAVGDQVGEGALVVTLEPVEQQGGSVDASVSAEQSQSREEGSVAQPAAPSSPEAASAQAPSLEPTADASQDVAAVVEVRVPDIGEATDVEVIEVAVVPGVAVAADDLLVVVESDKASMEIPAGHAGTVTAVHVEVGSAVVEGTLLATIEGSADQTGATVPPASAQPPVPAGQASAAPTPASAAAATPAPAGPAPAVPAPEALERSSARQPGEARVYAGPAVRRLARELGVPLDRVEGSGNRGRILKDDVKSFVKKAMTSEPDKAGAGIPTIPAVDFSRFGPIEVQPLSRIQAAGAANLHRSWLNLPHVTQFEDADVTELEAFRKTLKEEAARREVKITPLAFIVKACCYALQAFPTFNASLDGEAKNFILKQYYHIGIAVDTEQGLVVPVIRDADQLGVWELSRIIAELSEKARTQNLSMSDLQGGSFSISSLGGIGGTGFTPIINAPEVAILGVSKLITRPMWDGETFEPRQMLPLSLSYDHRAINGAEAGRFMAMLAELLGDIRRLSL
jgi:pyruvate dehydrogenase E2 component (dihydrolipoamide acetyltransferase)